MFGYVFDIKKFAIHDGPGIRTTIFLKGCPLRCWWCHNPESIKKIATENDNMCNSHDSFLVRKYSVDELISVIMKDEVFYDESGGGVTFSGGEPLIQIDFLEKMLERSKKEGVHTVVDTSGYAPLESLKRIHEKCDQFLFDLKIFNEESHKAFTGASNKIIFENLKFLDSVNSNINIRIPLIPGVTDTKENLSSIADYVLTLKNVTRINLLPYNELAEDKYRRLNQESKLGKLETQSVDKLNQIKSYMESFGLNVQLNG